MEKEFNEQDSLRVINEMINTARGNLKNGSGKYFLLWGYYYTISLIIQQIVSVAYPSLLSITTSIFLGLLLLPIVLTPVLVYRDKKKIVVSTHIDKIVAQVWIGFGLCILFLAILVTASQRGVVSAEASRFSFSAIVLGVYAYTLFITAKVYRFRWIYISVGIVVLCMLSYLFIPHQYNYLPTIIAIIAGNIVPGHLLNSKANDHV